MFFSTGTLFKQKWPNTSCPWLGPPSVFVQAGAFFCIVNRSVRALASCPRTAQNQALPLPWNTQLGLCVPHFYLAPEEKLHQALNSCSRLGTSPGIHGFLSDSLTHHRWFLTSARIKAKLCFDVWKSFWGGTCEDLHTVKGWRGGRHFLQQCSPCSCKPTLVQVSLNSYKETPGTHIHNAGGERDQLGGHESAGVSGTREGREAMTQRHNAHGWKCQNESHYYV